MSFWATVLGVIVGIFLWNILTTCIKVSWSAIEKRCEKKRQIGFGSEEVKEKTRKGVTMRKIGFGEQD